MKPFLKYRGGKLIEIKNFAQYIPKNFDTYIEPFVGGGAVYFHLEHRKAIINDLNYKLITTYVQIKENYAEVRKQLDALQEIYERNQALYEKLKARHPEKRVKNDNEALYYKLRDVFNHPNNDWLEAVIYFFINKTSYSGMIRYNKNGDYNVPFGRYKHFNTKILSKAHHDLLRDTEIYNKDYKQIFDMAKPDDFMFLDPPYDCVFHDYGNLECTGPFDENEHRRLAADFKNLHCKTLMVISKTDLTTELYKNYIVDSYHKNYAVNIRNRFKNEAQHYIITNYHHTSIFFPSRSNQ
ncbi:MAG TPA: Dam family site-specific DNA-(adenine-N6)-methyltransferase, partial [Bacilli bacterium]